MEVPAHFTDAGFVFDVKPSILFVLDIVRDSESVAAAVLMDFIAVVFVALGGNVSSP